MLCVYKGKTNDDNMLVKVVSCQSSISMSLFIVKYIFNNIMMGGGMLA